MKILKAISVISVPVIFSMYACNSGNNASANHATDSSTIFVNPKEMKYIGSVNERYQSYNVENEPTMPTAGGAINKNYNAGNFAKNEAAFKSWARKEVPDMLIVVPGSIGEGLPGVSLAGMGMPFLSTDSMMSAEPMPVFDIFSYHYYGAASMRMMRSGPFSVKAENALDSNWLHRTGKDLRSRMSPSLITVEGLNAFTIIRSLILFDLTRYFYFQIISRGLPIIFN